MATRVHDFINLSDKRRVFGVGDIHGCFDKLEEALKAVDFDPEAGDVLISTGDLVDRGPKSHEAVYWVAKPWFYRVIGNHERMTLDHLNGDSYMHTINGGGWMAEMSPEEKEAHATILNDAPMMLTVLTPKGQRIGFVHADLAFRDWQQNIEEPHFQTLCWSRQMVKMLSDPDFVPVIRGVDKVFFGHNAMNNAFSRGNCSWIDTGCGFEDGKLTVVDIESFGNIISE